MNKKRGLLFLFLIISVIMIIMTSVNGTDITVTDSEMKIAHDYSDNQVIEKTINNNQETQYKKDNNTINKITETSDSNKYKRVDKNINTQLTKTATPSTLTIGSTKNAYVNDNVAVYGKLSANGVNIPDAVVTIEANGQTYSVKTSKYGNYNTNVTISTWGTSKIIATYYGSNSYAMSTNQTYVNINKKNTLLTLGSTKSIYVGDNVNIYGKLTGDEKNIANAEISIEIDGKDYTATTSQYGNYNLNVPLSSTGYKSISAYYTGSNIYNSSINETYVNVKKNISYLTLGSAKNAYAGDKINVYGKLTANGKNVPNAKITIYADNKAYTAFTTKYGNYNINVTIYSTGNQVINATYPGSTINTNDFEKTTLNVKKKNTLLTLGSTKNIYVDNKVTIYGKLTANGKNVPNEKIIIKVDGQTTSVTTNKYGNYNTKITLTSTGYKTITATYSGSNIYNSNTNNTYVNVNKKESILTIGSISTAYIYDKISVYGKLTANGKNVPNAKITIKIDDKTFTTTTSQYGNYKLNITSNTTGTKSITVKYDGSNKIIGSNNNTYVDIVKKDTEITLGSTDTVYIGDSISIYGKLSSRGYGLSNKQVNIVVDNSEYTVTTNKYGDYNLKITAEHIGTVNIWTYYSGSNVYYNCYGLDTSTTVVKKETTITVGSTNTVYIGDSISIYGRLSSRGYGLSYKQVNIAVDNSEYTVTTNQYGDYNLKVTTDYTGTVYIGAYYGGSDVYYDTNSTSHTNVVKKDSTITLGSTSTVYVGDSINIYGRLSSKGYSLPNKQVKVDVNGKKYSVTTNKYGDYNLKVTADYTGTWQISANYEGSNIYKGNTSLKSYTKVVKKDSTITLGSTSTVYVGDSISIYGRLSSRGYGLSNKQVIIDVDGYEYKVTTNKYGDYNLKVTADYTGTWYITSKYAGSNIYYSSTSSTSYTKVTYKETSITVGCTQNVYIGDKVAVYGKLTANGKNVANAKVTINVDGQTYSTTTSSYGNYNKNITINTEGYKTITVSYEGNNNYLSSSNETYVNVDKKSTLLTVGCSDTINVGDGVNIYGKLTSRGYDVAYEDIIIDVDGTRYYTTTNKYGNYNIITDDMLYLGKVYIKAYYDGNNIYKASSVSTSCNIVEKYGTLVINTDSLINNNYAPYKRYVGDDEFCSWYQTYDGQWYKGVYVDVEDVYATDMGDAPHHLITDATFYFKDDYGNIISRNFDDGNGKWISHDLISGYTPFKVVIKYRKMSSYERYIYENGYGWDPRTNEWHPYSYYYDF